MTIRDDYGVDVTVRKHGRFVGSVDRYYLTLHWLLSWLNWDDLMLKLSIIALERAARSAADDHSVVSARRWLDRAEKLAELRQC